MRHDGQEQHDGLLLVAANACYDYLRAKSPARNRLKNNLRGPLERHMDFAMWRMGEGEALCGFTVWLNSGKSPSQVKRFSSLEAKLQEFLSAKFPREDVSNLRNLNRPTSLATPLAAADPCPHPPTSMLVGTAFNSNKDRIGSVIKRIIWHSREPPQKLQNRCEQCGQCGQCNLA